MRSARARLLVLLPWILTLVLFVTVTTAALAATLSPDFGMDVSTAGFLALATLWALVQSTVGTAIAWRRPENRIGRLMQLTGPLIISVFIGFIVAAVRYLMYGPTDWLGGVAGWWGSITLIPVVVLAFPALALLFPDGRLPGPSFRLPVLAVAAAMVGIVATYALTKGQLNEGLPDNPFGLVDVPLQVIDLADGAGAVALVASMGIGIAAVAVRWRRGTAVERAQLKWLLAPLTLGVISFGFAFGSSMTDPADLVSFISALLVPVSVGIAVLRYRLYDIDRLISRTVSWALVSGALLVVFAAAVVALHGLLAGITQGQTLAVAASTLLAFALFQPLRRRVQGAVDRRFDRAGYDAQRTADAFAERVRNEVDLATLRAALKTSAGAAVLPVNVAVWLRGAAGDVR